MPTPTYTPLATVTLGTATSSVTFSSIPATYRDLIVVITGTVITTAGNILIRLNGDSGSNYPWVVMLGDGSTTLSASGTITGLLGGGFNTSVRTQAIFQIMDYSATDKHKTALVRTDEPNGAPYAHATRWANTAAVNSLSVTTNVGSNFSVGNTFNLYGVIA
jgi:hypothetical protein